MAMDKRWIILVALLLVAVGARLLFQETASAPSNPEVHPIGKGASAKSATHPAAWNPSNISQDERRILTQVQSLLNDQKADPESVNLNRLMPLMQQAKTAPQPPVRAAAMTGLATVGHADPQVIHTFVGGLEDGSELVRIRALAGLRRLSGRSFKDYKPDAPEHKRREAMKRIKAIFENAKKPQKDA